MAAPETRPQAMVPEEPPLHGAAGAFPGGAVTPAPPGDFSTDWPEGLVVAVVPMDHTRQRWGIRVMDVRDADLLRSVTLAPDEWRQVIRGIERYLPLAEAPGSVPA